MKNKNVKILLVSTTCIVLASIIAYFMGAALSMDFDINNWSEENRNGFISLVATVLILTLMIWVFKTIIDLCE